MATVPYLVRVGSLQMEESEANAQQISVLQVLLIQQSWLNGPNPATSPTNLKPIKDVCTFSEIVDSFLVEFHSVFLPT